MNRVILQPIVRRGYMKRLSTPLLALALASGAQAMTPDEFTRVVIHGMQGPNDGSQINYNRVAWAQTMMGLKARGDYTPSWYNPPNRAWKSSTAWTAITPWWQVVPLVGNTVAKPQVEIGTTVLMARRAGTQTWITVANEQDGWVAVSSESGTPGAAPAQAAGTVSGYKSKVYTMAGGSSTLHGGPGVYPFNHTLYDGIITCTAARTAGAAASTSRIALWSGTDYYPYAGADVNQSGGYWPAMASGRLARVTPQWQAFCNAPLDNPGHAGDDGSYINNNGVFMSVANLLANPVAEPTGLLPAGTTPPTPPPVDPPPPPPVEPPPTGCTTCPAGPPGPVGPPGKLEPCLSTAIPAGLSWHTVIATANTALAKCGR